MDKLRVMLVDDSSLIRRLLTSALSTDPELQIVSSVPNGKVALEKLEEAAPDVVVLDIEMPELDGLATLTELRRLKPRLPVIMFSTLTERAGVATLDALSRGASDYVTKPSNTRLDLSLDQVRTQLCGKIRALCGRASAPTSSAPSSSSAPSPLAAARRRTTTSPARVQAIAIGVSTGGPNALDQVLPALPKNLRVPVLIVQHMPQVFTRLLADRLATRSQIRVCEAVHGQVAEAGCAYVAPGDFHMELRTNGARLEIALHQDAHENSCRPAVDVLFRSVARACGAGSLGVILTGMGQDGLRGSEALHATGAEVIAQDEATSVVWSMPGHVVRAGLASNVLPIGEIAAELVRRAEARAQPVRAL